MDKKTLGQYRTLQREIPQLKNDIEKLYEKLENVPVVKGKVIKSSDDFPYIEEHISVEMDEPKEATVLRKRIRIKELRLEKAEENKISIEKFIAGIENSEERQILDYAFLSEKRMTQAKIGEKVGCDQSTVSRTIRKYL